jgi:hypothetical protein
VITIAEISRLVHAYAPKLDLEDKVKFSMYVHNKYAYESDLNDLNLSNEWRGYKSETN